MAWISGVTAAYELCRVDQTGVQGGIQLCYYFPFSFRTSTYHSSPSGNPSDDTIQAQIEAESCREGL